MRNIIDYIKEEHRTFDEKKLNQVDSLIFSNLTYINLEYALQSDDNRFFMSWRQVAGLEILRLSILLI